MADQIPNMDYDADEVIENFKSKFKWPSKDEVEVVVKPPKLGAKILLDREEIFFSYAFLRNAKYR